MAKVLKLRSDNDLAAKPSTVATRRALREATVSEFELLDGAIKAAMAEMPEATNTEIARHLYGKEIQMLGAFIPRWITERLTALVGKQRTKLREENPSQIVLFEHALGVERMPRKMKRKDGTTILSDEASIGTLKLQVVDLRKQKAPALESVLRAIDLMKNYTTAEPRIKWGEVAKREAERAARARDALKPPDAPSETR